jgi:signal transduction histidine kinase
VRKGLIDKFRRFQLSILIVIVFAGFFGSCTGILIMLGKASMDKARTVRSEFLERDLRDLVGRFDADERYVLEHNIVHLVTERRPIAPLLLPRQYFVGLPLHYQRVSPRQPPRNCFVDLVVHNQDGKANHGSADKVCPYFAENGALGKFLFLAADINDDTIVPLKAGDLSLTADALKMTVVRGSKSTTWWLTLQPPPSGPGRGRYEITAIRENPDGTFERDKRVEGWAWTQRQADDKQVVHIIARIDFKEFAPELETAPSNEAWPPTDWENIRLQFGRKDVGENRTAVRTTAYDSVGWSLLSLVNLADPIFDSHAELSIRRTHPSQSGKQWAIAPSVSRDEPWANKTHSFRLIDGDLLLANNELTRFRSLPDTTLEFVVRHPGTIVERGLWQTLLALSVVFVIGLGFAVYFSRNLLIPIFRLTRQIRQLVEHPSSNDHQLPYADQRNELGTLAKGFNDLLANTRSHIVREHEEHIARRAAEDQRLLDEVSVRERNLDVIGHEIRSPLQSLMSMHDAGTRSRHFLDRITAALPHLQGTLRPEDAFNARPMQLENRDIASFLTEVVSNARLVGMERVEYEGPSAGLFCLVDPEALEDCIDHVLNNADRLRLDNSTILVTLKAEGADLVIWMANTGPQIEESIRDRIWDYAFSTRPNQDGGEKGIGLFVVRQYVSQMHGAIDFANTEEGVCFRIKFPLFTEN